MNFLGRKRKDQGLINKQIRVGAYNVRCDSLVAEGGFSAVYRAEDPTTQKMLALKHVRLGGNSETIAHVKKEVGFMKALRGSPNILTLRAVAFNGPPGQEQDAYLLMDLCDGGTLAQVLQAAEGALPDAAVLRVARDVCSAVAGMHAHHPPIAHRDLKLENVMLHSSGAWMLCDMGSASTDALPSASAGNLGLLEDDIRRHTTPAYRAPEMYDLYSRMPIDHRVDLWALGCLLFAVAFGSLPFQPEAKLQILNGDYRMPEGRSPAIRSIIHDLLKVHPHERADAREILERVSNELNGGTVPAMGMGRQHSGAQQADHSNAAAAAPSGDWWQQHSLAAAADPPGGQAHPSAPPPKQPASGSAAAQQPAANAVGDPSPQQPPNGRQQQLQQQQRRRQEGQRSNAPAAPPTHRSSPNAVQPVQQSRPSVEDVQSLRTQLAEERARSEQLSATVEKQNAIIQQLRAQLATQQDLGSEADRTGAVSQDSDWIAFSGSPKVVPSAQPAVEAAFGRSSTASSHQADRWSSHDTGFDANTAFGSSGNRHGDAGTMDTDSRNMPDERQKSSRPSASNQRHLFWEA